LKKALSICLALLIAASLNVMAFGEIGTGEFRDGEIGTGEYRDGEIKVQRVRIYSRNHTVRVGNTLEIEARIYPEHAPYERIEWDVSNWDIAGLDNYYGYNDRYVDLVAYRPGTVNVMVRVYDWDGRRVAGDVMTVTVTGPGGRPDPTPTPTPTPRPVPNPTPQPANIGGKISEATVTSAVRAKAERGKITHTTFRGYTSVSANTLKAANTEMQKAGGVVRLKFDTLSDANPKSVEGRMTVDPRNTTNVKGDIQLGVFTNDGATGDTRRAFENSFSNRFAVIRAAHSGSYGMKVDFAVKTGSHLSNATNLFLYSYNPKTAQYQLIQNPKISFDSNGFLHFTSSIGNDLIVSDGPLRSR